MEKYAGLRRLYLLGVAMGRLLSTVVSLALTALQLWVPAAVLYLSYPHRAHADDFMDAARQGQNLGLGLLPDASTLGGLDPSGNVQLNWKGNTTTITPQKLFSDTQNTTDPGAQSTYGKDAEAKNLANDQVTSMSNSSSQTGKAYQALINGINQLPHTDFSNKDMWNQTDDQLSKVLQGYYNDLSNCQSVTTTTTTTTTTHIPDTRTCERIVFPGNSCKCRHDYSVELLGYYSVGAAGWSVGNLWIDVDLKTGQVVNCGGGYGCSVTLYGVSSPPPSSRCMQCSN